MLFVSSFFLLDRKCWPLVIKYFSFLFSLSVLTLRPQRFFSPPPLLISSSHFCFSPLLNLPWFFFFFFFLNRDERGGSAALFFCLRGDVHVSLSLPKEWGFPGFFFRTCLIIGPLSDVQTLFSPLFGGFSLCIYFSRLLFLRLPSFFNLFTFPNFPHSRGRIPFFSPFGLSRTPFRSSLFRTVPHLINCFAPLFPTSNSQTPPPFSLYPHPHLSACPWLWFFFSPPLLSFSTRFSLQMDGTLVID